MNVKLRWQDDIDGQDFCEIEPSERAVENLLAFLRRSGVYRPGQDHYRDLSYQIVLDESSAYCEIIVAEGDEETAKPVPLQKVG